LERSIRNEPPEEVEVKVKEQVNVKVKEQVVMLKVTTFIWGRYSCELFLLLFLLILEMLFAAPF
jgi:hypothetical protein